MYKTHIKICAGDVDYVMVVKVPKSGAKGCGGLGYAAYATQTSINVWQDFRPVLDCSDAIAICTGAS